MDKKRQIVTVCRLNFRHKVPGTCQAWHFNVYLKGDYDVLCIKRKRQTYSNVRAQSYESCETRDCQAAGNKKTPKQTVWAFFFGGGDELQPQGGNGWGPSPFGLRMTSGAWAQDDEWGVGSG